MSLKRSLSEDETSDSAARSSAERPSKVARGTEPVERVPSVETSDILPIACLRTSWLGAASFETVVIFGDSYSTPADTEPGEVPSESESEGIDATENATWVDYLQQRLRKHTRAVHNFSFPGATAEDDLETQLARFFAKFPPKGSPKSGPPLDSSRTVYAFFLGINDCGATDEDDLDEIVEKVLDAAHELYVKAGTRNFVFMDVIPMERTPGAQNSGSEDTMRLRVEAWNDALRTRVDEFAESAGQASALLFSTNAAFAEILEDPEEFGYTEDDPTDESGGIWLDEIHATSSVHKILAERFRKALLPDL